MTCRAQGGELHRGTKAPGLPPVAVPTEVKDKPAEPYRTIQKLWAKVIDRAISEAEARASKDGGEGESTAQVGLKGGGGSRRAPGPRPQSLCEHRSAVTEMQARGVMYLQQSDGWDRPSLRVPHF